MVLLEGIHHLVHRDLKVTGHSLVLTLSNIKWQTLLSLSLPPEMGFWRLKHYLRIIVCQHGVHMEIKIAESN